MRITKLTNGAVLISTKTCSLESLAPLHHDMQVEADGDGPPPDYDAVRQKLLSLIETHSEEPSDSDIEAAVAIRSLLPLSRRQAADREFWHFVTLRHCFEYARWRWGKGDPLEVPRERLLGAWPRNAIARLWWTAELTRHHDDYSITEKLRGRQDAALWTVDALFAPSLLKETIFAVEESGIGSKGIQTAFKRAIALQGTHLIEAISPDELQRVVRSLAAPSDDVVH